MAENFLKEHSIDVAAFCEGEDYYSPGKQINGKPVYKYGSLPPELEVCNLVFSASGSGVKNFLNSSLKTSFKTKGKVYVFVAHASERYVIDPLMPPLKKKHEKLYFEVHIVEHCNLNCAGCLHFSPLAEPECVDVDEFARDMKRLGEIFSHECQEIRLMGGEPLLHSGIIPLMESARENFSRGIITIVTNGILLSQEKDAFWEACHKNRVRIWISAYPIKLDVEKIRALAKKFDVDVQWAGGQQEFERDTFRIYPPNLSGDGDIRLNFYLCSFANRCIQFSHGRLFTCVFAAYVRFFNKKFGQNIPVTTEDYVDIYQETDKEVILQKLAEPIPVCRYCDKTVAPRSIQWHISSGDIGEWV